MSTRGNYKSKNHELILEYMQTVPGKHLTVEEIHAALEQRGCTIGFTTVYRQLNRMVDDGLINKYTIEPNMPACYEYIRIARPEELLNCYHCKCEVCGRLIHLQCEEISEFTEHLKSEHKFTLNPMRTVLYGVCEDCAKHTKIVR